MKDLEEIERLLAIPPRINTECDACDGTGTVDATSEWSLDRIRVDCGACAYRREGAIAEGNAALRKVTPALLTELRRLRTENATQRDALVEAREVLALCTTRTFDAQPEDGIMRELGPRHGFGALMSAASKEWAAYLAREGLPAGSQHTSGPCAATVESTLAIIDAALPTPGAGR
jgi:hypothetical protein